MKTFDVYTTVTFTMAHFVEANSIEEAEQKAKKSYEEEEMQQYAAENLFAGADYEIVEIKEVDNEDQNLS